MIIAETDSKPGEFSVFISDFGNTFRCWNIETFTLNGENVMAKLTETKRNADHDVMYWLYTEIGGTRTVKIFND